MKNLCIIVCFIVIFVMLIFLFKNRETFFQGCRTKRVSDSKLFQDAQGFTKQVSEMKSHCGACGSKRNNNYCPVVKGVYAPCKKN
jgi:hypothetical protein